MELEKVKEIDRMAPRVSSSVSNEERRQRSTSLILDAAERLFVESGYAATSVERIAAEAGLTKGAIYFYYSNKEGLLDALIARSEESAFTPPLAILAERGRPALDRIIQYFNYHGASIADARSYLVPVAVLLQLDAVPSASRERATALFAKVQTQIADVIAEGQAAGEVDRVVRPREAAALIQALIEGMLLQWLRRAPGFDGNEFLRTGRRALLAGLRLNSHHGADASTICG